MSCGESFQSWRPRSNFLWLILAVLVLLGVASWWQLRSRGRAAPEPNAVMRAVPPRGDLAAEEKTTIAIFRRNSPSVVHITTLVNAASDDFGFDVQQVPAGTGSGFVWDKKGHVVFMVGCYEVDYRRTFPSGQKSSSHDPYEQTWHFGPGRQGGGLYSAPGSQFGQSRSNGADEGRKGTRGPGKTCGAVAYPTTVASQAARAMGSGQGTRGNRRSDCRCRTGQYLGRPRR